MSLREKTIAILLFAVVLSSAALPSCCNVRGRRIIEETRFLMGTDVRIKVSIGEIDDELQARSAIEKAFKEIERVEGVFSVYRPDSEISKINLLRKNERLRISPEAFSLIKRSIEYSRLTDGAFDITVKPLVDLWHAAKDNNKLPADEDIKNALARTGYEDVALDGAAHTILFRKEGMALDLGGVAKGYATGRAIKILRDSGIKDAIVGSGGNLYCLGKKTDAESWTVAIQHPRKKDKVFMEIKLSDKAIDTSGDYEKYFILENKRYSHIINPKTGYPAAGHVISSTVIAGDPDFSDMLATAIMVLGQKGLNIAGSIRDIDAIAVFERNDRFIVMTTEGITGRYDIKEEKL